MDSTIVGENPPIDNEISPQEGVPIEFEFRSIYATMLVQWLGASEEDGRKVLCNECNRIPFIKDCSQSSSVTSADETLQVTVLPNPATDYIEVNWESKGGLCQISVMNATGALVQNIMERNLFSGQQKINIPVQHYNKGSYFIYIREGSLVKTLKWIKV